MGSYLPLNIWNATKTSQWIAETNEKYQHGISRPKQVARGQYMPRTGLSRGQNAYMDMLGVDDQFLLDPQTSFGRDYWAVDQTETQPVFDTFNEKHPVLAAQSPQFAFMQSPQLRAMVIGAGAEGATDPMVVGPKMKAMSFALWRAVRYNRFAAGAVTNFATWGRMFRDFKLKNVPTNWDGPSAAPMAMFSSKNHQLAAHLNQTVYGAYQARPLINSIEQATPSAKGDQAGATMKPGRMMQDPQRMNNEEYIDWVMDGSDEHKANVVDLAVQWFGQPLGEIIYDPVPLKQGQLVRPDSRSDALESTRVPRRLDAVQPLQEGEEAPLGEAPEASVPGLRAVYDGAVASHAQGSGGRGEVDRIASAGAFRYYEQAHNPVTARQYFNTYRMDNQKFAQQIRDDLIMKDEAYEALHTEFMKDASRGADRIRSGRLPNTVDLSDLDSAVYWAMPHEGGQSEILDRILHHEVADLPWSVKPANRRRLGYTVPRQQSPGTGDLGEFKKAMHEWQTSSAKFRAGAPDVDFGKIFSTTLDEGDLAGSMWSMPAILEAVPEYRDMFHNPLNGNIYELVDYLKRNESGFLREVERSKLDQMQRTPHEARFSQRFPLVRMPGDVVFGPTMAWNAEGQTIETGVQALRTHVEMTRAATALLGDKSRPHINQMVTERMVPSFYGQGFTAADGPMYDPYHGFVYGQEVIDGAVDSALTPFMKAAAASDRKDDLEPLVRGARDYLIQNFRKQMVGTVPSSPGVQTLLDRSRDGNWRTYMGSSDPFRTPMEERDPNATPYRMGSAFHATEEEALETLRQEPEFASIEASTPYERFDESLAKHPQRQELSPELIGKLQAGIPQGGDDRMIASDSIDRFVEAGGTSMFMHPVMTSSPTNAMGMYVGTMTPATAEMLDSSRRELAGLYHYGLTGNSYSEQAVVQGAGADRNVHSSEIHIADRSLTSMIQRAEGAIGRTSAPTNKDLLQAFPKTIKDVAAGKFFDELIDVDADNQTMIGELIEQSANKSAWEITLQSGSPSEIATAKASYLWPKDQYFTKIELNDQANNWSAGDIYKQYSTKVRDLFLAHPEIMSLNLASAFEEVLGAASAPTSEAAFGGIQGAIERLAYDVVPNYEMVVGSDPIARTTLMHLIDELGHMDPGENSSDFPAIVKDVKSLIFHMDGQFDAMHQGALTQTLLRGMHIPEEKQQVVLDYVQGYTQNMLGTAEAVTGQQFQAVQNLMSRIQGGGSIASGWTYDVAESDITSLQQTAGRVDRPIRMDPSSMSLASHVGLEIGHLDKTLRHIASHPAKPVTPEMANYLMNAAEAIDHTMQRLQISASDHYLTSVHNLAYDPDMSSEDLQMYFQVQPSSLFSVSDNPGAMALAKKWEDSGINAATATQEATLARANGAITASEHEGLMQFIEIRDFSSRNKMLDVLMDVYAAHKPDAMSMESLIAFRNSKYGPDMQELVTKIKSDRKFAELFVSRVVLENDLNYMQSMHLLSDRLGIKLLDFAKTQFLPYDASADDLIRMLGGIIVDQISD